jgi:O-antigen ligase
MGTVFVARMHFATLTARIETGARACAIALGFTIPISVALDNVLLVLVLVFWLASGGYREKITLLRHNPVAMAALALFCLLGAGVTYSASGAGEGLNALGKYIDLAFVPIFASLFRTEQARKYAWLALASALTLTLLLSCLIATGRITDNFLFIGDSTNPAVFKHYLTQGLFMAFGAFLFAQLACAARTTAYRYGWWTLAGLAAINVALMSQSRTGQLILLAVMLYLVHSVWSWRGTLVAIVGPAIVVGALAIGHGAVTARFGQAVDEWKAWRPDQAAQTSTGFRLEFYRNSLQIFGHHPLLGTGTGSFPKVYAEHVTGTAMQATVNPHNEYLNIAVQLGAFGLFLMLALFYREWRLAPSLPTPHEQHLTRALVITFVLGCTFNSLLMDHAEGLLFAWATGLLFSGLPSPSPAPQRAA